MEGGEKSLLCDPGSELRLGGREKKRRAKITNGKQKSTAAVESRKYNNSNVVHICEYDHTTHMQQAAAAESGGVVRRSIAGSNIASNHSSTARTCHTHMVLPADAGRRGRNGQSAGG